MKSKKIEYTPTEYLREIIHTLHKLAKDNRCSFLTMLLLFVRGYLSRHVQIEEFRTLALYRCSAVEARHYLTYNQSIRYSDRLNRDATPEDTSLFDDKSCFCAFFSDYIHRNWLYIPDATPEDIQAFLQRNSVFLLKACTSTQGKNIFLFQSADVNVEELLAEYGEKPFLMEAFISQHPALSAINPSSVNSIRLVTAQKGGHVSIIGAGLRCGGADQFVDNFHHGGVAYPIDLETGIISGAGTDIHGARILCHPSTGCVVPGLRIPYWNDVINAVTNAALQCPRVGYIGWDIAITTTGIEFIEGNINYPGNTIIQVGGPGPLERLKELINR